jgi:hypothetical protein
MFVGVLSISIPTTWGQGSITITTDQRIYPVWKIGGTVKVTATELPPNSTYYLWLQKPKTANTTFTGVKIQETPASNPVAQLTVTSGDPSGSYLLSLSSSSLIDTRIAVAHFGVFGTDKAQYQRTETIIIAGGGFSPNSIVSVELKNATGPVEAFPSSLNATERGEINYTYKISASAENATWTLSADGVAFDNQDQTSTSLSISIRPANLRFRLRYEQAIERTTVLTVNSIVTYPDGSVLTLETLGVAVNVTLSATNFTRTSVMSYNDTTLSWSAGFPIARNQSLGQYTIRVRAWDGYGNSGDSTAYTAVIPAKLLFALDPNVKAPQSASVDVAVYVQYPDGSYLTDRFGGQVIAYTNSSGVLAYAMIFDNADFKWHLTYTSPELGFTFGKTVNIYFNATDEYGNSGSAAKFFTIQVGADTGTIVLSVVAAAIVPAALLIWAIFTISSRRRKYKP